MSSALAVTCRRFGFTARVGLAIYFIAIMVLSYTDTARHTWLAAAHTHANTPGEGQLQQQVCGNANESRDGAATQPRQPTTTAARRPTAATTPVGSTGFPVARWHAGGRRLPKGIWQHIVDGAPALAGAVGVTAVRAVGAISRRPVSVEGGGAQRCRLLLDVHSVVVCV